MTHASTKPDTELTLRDVARRLGDVPQVDSYYSLAARELLTFLRSGQLSAFAYFPSRLVPQLAISPEYWRSINNKKFKQIELSEKPGRKGTYSLQADRLYETYLDELLSPSTAADFDLAAIKNDLQAVNRQLGSFCEVLIKRTEWERFLDKHGYEEVAEDEDATDSSEGERRGRPSKNWREMIPYFVCALERQNEQLENKYESTAIEIVTMAKRDNLTELPTISTLSQEVGKVVRTVRRIRSQP